MRQMIWLQWFALGLSAVLVASVIVLAAGALVSLDWKRKHRRQTESLAPLFDPATQPDGLTTIRVGEFSFRARVANLCGRGDAVIMLHGFPQTSAAWQPLIEAAAARDYRLVAFDQRGYSPGARPPGVDQYRIDKLVADVIGVADAVGFERFHLVGHDWGAAVGWGVVMTQSPRILSFTALSIAHSFAFLEALQTDPDQRRRSRYILLFRRPWLPEMLLGFGNRWLLRSIMYRHMPAEHATEYAQVFAEPGALTGALNWYRAMGRSGGLSPDPHIDVPTLFIWGRRDPAAGPVAVDLQSKYLRGQYRRMDLDAGHWLLERRTAEVVDAILQHLGRSGADDG